MIAFPWRFCFGVCIYLQYFFEVAGNKLQTIKIYTRDNNKRSSVQENNMLCELALNFHQWKTFSEKL